MLRARGASYGSVTPTVGQQKNARANCINFVKWWLRIFGPRFVLTIGQRNDFVGEPCAYQPERHGTLLEMIDRHSPNRNIRSQHAGDMFDDICMETREFVQPPLFLNAN